jgi:hypothetical protein
VRASIGDDDVMVMIEWSWWCNANCVTVIAGYDGISVARWDDIGW